MPGTFIVHFVDDDADDEDLKELWTRIAERIWADVRIDRQKEFDDLAFTNDRPHLIVVDNVLVRNNKEYDNKGVELISRNRKKFPDSIFILFTGNTFAIDSLGYYLPNPDILVTKTQFPDEEYEGELCRRISRILKRLPIKRLNITDPSVLTSSGLDEYEVKSVVEQCAFPFQYRSGGTLDFLDPIENVSLSRLGGGYSGSHIFKCDFWGEKRSSNSKFVLKISDRESSFRETENYNHYARLQMPHHIRVDLIETGETESLGGALYAFAFGGEGDISSITDDLKNGDMKSLEKFLNQVLSNEIVGWYIDNGDSVTVGEYFNKRDEYNTKKDTSRIAGIEENIIKHSIVDSCTLDQENIKLLNINTLHCRRLFHSFRNEKFPLSISHGDLNTNNIITFEGAEKFSLIDFDYTGLDSIYKDFISLETSYRVYYKPDSFDFGVKNYFEIEQYMNKAFFDKPGDTRKKLKKSLIELEEYAGGLLNLRKFAYEFIVSRGFKFDQKHYLILLSFHLFKLSALPAWQDVQFHRILSAYVSSNCSCSEA